MFKNENLRYNALNKIADSHGIVILGCGEDFSIPVGELRQAFAITPKIYNRSFPDLSVKEAITIYDEYVSTLTPETVLLHIGMNDLDFFHENSTLFIQKYRDLLAHIRQQNANCRIAIIALKNYNNNSLIGKLNTHLKYLSESEHCEYIDISAKKLWNPKGTMDAVSFVYSIGFVHPLQNKRPLYDLAKIFFCYEA